MDLPDHPFLLAGPGVTVSGIGAWREGDETWRGLRATFPEDVATHSRQQDFYFDEALRLRRYDYHVEIAGGFACAQYVHDYVEAQGLRMPSKRRVHLRAEDGSPRRDTLLVSIDVSDVHYA